MEYIKPFFSVVIPVYNAKLYLNKCIESILNQDFKDYEIVLVDDSSTDGSGQICDELHDAYPDIIRVYHQENTGVYIAKRNGIKLSRGKYIYVMDNDDEIIGSVAFGKWKEAIEKYNCDLLFFKAVDDINSMHPLCSFNYQNNTVFEGESLLTLYESFLREKKLHHIWMMLFHRDLFDWDYEYNKPFRMLRDGPSLIIPILSKATKVLYLDDFFYYWRIQNLASASKNYDVFGFYYSIRELHERIVYYSQGWKYKTDQTELLLSINYITDMCIAAIKLRGIKGDVKKRKECFYLMANDTMFRQEYTLKGLGAFRKPIAFALYHKWFWMVNMLSAVAGHIKRLV